MSDKKERKTPTALEELEMRIETLRRDRKMHIDEQESAKLNLEWHMGAINDIDALIAQYEDILFRAKSRQDYLNRDPVDVAMTEGQAADIFKAARWGKGERA